MASNEKLTTASVLAFERKLDPSDGVFYAGSWNDQKNSTEWSLVEMQSKRVRGTIANRLKKAIAEDPLKLDAEVEKANLQLVDVCMLPMNCDTIKFVFTVKVLGNVGQPNVCNKADYQKKLEQIVKSYSQQSGFKNLAERYAINLANARFLWRNRLGAEKIVVNISCGNKDNKKTWSFDALDFSLRDFNVPSKYQSAISEVATAIEQGLQGNLYTLLEIETFACIGHGQEIFPSQELSMEKNKKDDKSKTLYTIKINNRDIAAMHSQKIGNALRTIDDWHPEAMDMGPIAVEPYAAVTTRGHAYRHPKTKLDFYTLFDNWVLHDKAPELDQQHYVIANLIRGGVFGESGKE